MQMYFWLTPVVLVCAHWTHSWVMSDIRETFLGLIDLDMDDQSLLTLIFCESGRQLEFRTEPMLEITNNSCFCIHLL